MEKEVLGKQIRQARKLQKMKREDLAEKADISTVFLGEIERGKKLPSLNVFINIVEALGVSADFLLCHEVSGGKEYVFDEITQKLEGLTPKQRKALVDIINAYLQNL